MGFYQEQVYGNVSLKMKLRAVFIIHCVTKGTSELSLSPAPELIS